MTDASPEHIVMVDCPEIQEGHEWKYGDCFATEYATWRIGEAVIRDGKPIPTEMVNDPAGWGCEETKIFIPDQRWYQEQITTVSYALFNYSNSPKHYAVTFFYTLNEIMKHGWEYAETAEQALCKTFMLAIHNKSWNGKEWISTMMQHRVYNGCPFCAGRVLRQITPEKYERVAERKSNGGTCYQCQDEDCKRVFERMPSLSEIGK